MEQTKNLNGEYIIMDKVRVIEAFQSYQGEGISIGKRVLILRFKLCNRRCKFGNSDECDTALKMRISMEFDISLEEIQNQVDNLKLGLLITGGEPSFSHNLNQTIELVNKINAHFYDIETNGFQLINLIEKIQEDKNVHYMLSPKIFSAPDYEFYTDLISKIVYNNKVYIKLVYEDRPLIRKFLNYLQTINFDNQRIYLMPEGKTKEEILSHAPEVFDAAEEYKVNFSSREHIIYGFV